MAALGAIWVTCCATPAFVDRLQYGLESPYAFKVAATYPNEGAIVVFGGEILASKNIEWMNNAQAAATSRIGFGYQLFKAGRAPLILLSAGEGGALRMARMLEQQGVPPAVLLIESKSRTTYENSLYSANILKRKGIQHVLLVTSPLHMPRAMASLRKQGIDVVPAPVLIHRKTDPVQNRHRWTPQRTELWRCSHILHEYIGIWSYKLLGKS